MVITDFAVMSAPFRETLKFADLGADLKQYDVAISSIAVASTVVTITTDEVHGRSTGDTVFLYGIEHLFSTPQPALEIRGIYQSVCIEQ